MKVIKSIHTHFWIFQWIPHVEWWATDIYIYIERYWATCVKQLAAMAWSKSTAVMSSIRTSNCNYCQFQVGKTVGWLKCTMDVAFLEDDRRVLLGCCVCDLNGRFITVQTRWKRMKVFVLKGEEMTLFEAIRFISSKGWHNVIF